LCLFYLCVSAADSAVDTVAAEDPDPNDLKAYIQ
jgi:hypothetical protein